MISFSPLWAAGNARTIFEWGRIQANIDFVLPVTGCVLLLLYAGWLYRRDTMELGSAARLALTTLRALTIFGLLLVYLEPQWRIERDVVRNSRVVLLADTSLSMGLPDQEQNSVSGGPSRADRVIRALSEGELIARLRKTHDVVVLRFDQQTGNIVKLDKLGRDTSSVADIETDEDVSTQSVAKEQSINWSEALAPRGTETRLGQALRQLVLEERAGPVSGIVVITDGGQNSGIGPAAAIETARDAQIPIHTVGLGSARQPTNVRVGDLLAPARAYPGDTYTVTGFIQAQGMGDRLVTVELVSRPAESPDGKGKESAPGTAQKLEGAQDVTLLADGEAVPIKFELTPEATGRRTLTLRVQAPDDDGNPGDNSQEVDVEIVDRKTRILLFASGPSREYRFLHTFLHRDKNVLVDVLLQTAQAGVSQDANEILSDFPPTREALDKYDVIVAFDPDWKKLSPDEVVNLERWVGEQAGGLVVMPGPIHTHVWLQDPALAPLRDLYPVEFNRRFSVMDDGRFGAKTPWPIEFTREGLEAEFLWLGESASASQKAWAGFPGVFGYYAIRGAKPGAVVYGRYSDPRAATGGEQPVYFAGQFYGSGRVFYIGSAEMWRLRAIRPADFDEFYTKLLRHVSQGRLLRGSSRGVLLVERDRYFLGQTVAVRAQLYDTQLEPLQAANVAMEVYQPDGTLQSIQLTADPSRAGTFSGQFAVRQEGVCRLEVPVPDTESERLTRRIQVRVPDLERENPQRNDALLTEIARETSGTYYVGMDSLLGVNVARPLTEELRDRSLIIPVSEAPIPLWDNAYVMLGLCGLLAVEWLGRRLLKLA